MSGTVTTCAKPGCTEVGTKHCSACTTTLYCGPICQTSDWPNHRQSCWLKIGTDNLVEAEGYNTADNWVQALRYSDIALTKLKKVTSDRPLDHINGALEIKCIALKFMNRLSESLEVAEERYQLWALAKGPANPSTIDAAFSLIEGCVLCQKYADAEKYAYNLWDILNTNSHVDNDIPFDRYQQLLARGAKEYSRATFRLSHTEGIPTTEKEKAGQEAIALARRALEIYTQLYGTEHEDVANSMMALAQVLDHFIESDIDEVVSLYEQSMVIFSRLDGPLSPNVAASTGNIGSAYIHRAN